MDSSKEGLQVNHAQVNDVRMVEKEDIDEAIPSRYRGTAADKRDMFSLGKKQVLRVSNLEH